MRSAGLNQTSPGFFSSASVHPFSRRPVDVALEAEYRGSRQLWSLGLVAHRTLTGETLGYGGTNQFLFLGYGVTSVGAVFSLGPPVAHIGIGPAWSTTRVRPFQSGAQGMQHASSLGAVAQVRSQFPPSSRLFLDVTAGLDMVGRRDVGPYISSSFLDMPTTLPSTRANFSHWLITVGPGVRF